VQEAIQIIKEGDRASAVWDLFERSKDRKQAAFGKSVQDEWQHQHHC